MDFFMASTIVLGIWAALGPLVGVRYGQELARRTQREHWARDNARQECRELISTISNTFSIVIKYHAQNAVGIPMSGPHDATAQREYDAALQASYEIFYRQLFISDELLRRKIRDRWMAAVNRYLADRKGDAFTKEFGTIVREIREIAAKAIA